MLINKILLYSIVVFSCATTYPDKVIIEEPVKQYYPLIDNKAIMHKYRDNFDKMIFPQHNEKLTQYCAIHKNWEDIKAMWSKNGGDYYRWQYNVKKNKKSFK